MTTTPQKKTLKDKSLNFITDGYLFASRMRAKAGLKQNSHEPFTLKMLGKDATMIRGKEAVGFFYDESKISRDGAMPHAVNDTLFGKGTIHGLDGEAHKVRKAQMAAMAYDDDARVAHFADLVTEEMERTLSDWAEKPGNVYDDVAVAYGRAAFRWAGIPMTDEQMVKEAQRMSHLLDTFGNPLKNPLAWIDRAKLDRWFEQLIENVRSGTQNVDPDSVTAHIADLRDENGELVSARIAAIELQNLTRPTIAVSRFAAFAAVALVQNPGWAEKIGSAVEAKGSWANVPESIAFAQETRRKYPFVPMLPGYVKEDAEVSGCPVHKGQRILIDILGTNNSPQLWENAADFDPSRFMGVENWEDIAYFIPQGGGDVHTGHRCPGERIAVTALSVAISAMAQKNVHISQDQDDTEFRWDQILTRPKTGVRISVDAASAR
ncbi:cytochrome P450 [Rothia amarae]|uniref:cytochrome P450 n=1 Tax=Rothia amarae TaxID=169480 RepID=UPI001247C552